MNPQAASARHRLPRDFVVLNFGNQEYAIPYSATTRLYLGVLFGFLPLIANANSSSRRIASGGNTSEPDRRITEV
jgi:hypothetical protein